jgi:hypothetical protein
MAGFTVVESDYVCIAPATSTLHRKVLAYQYTKVSNEGFCVEAFRFDTNDARPVNLDLYTLTLVGSHANMIGPTRPSSGHHLEDLPPHLWANLPTTDIGSF